MAALPGAARLFIQGSQSIRPSRARAALATNSGPRLERKQAGKLANQNSFEIIVRACAKKRTFGRIMDCKKIRFAE